MKPLLTVAAAALLACRHPAGPAGRASPSGPGGAPAAGEAAAPDPDGPHRDAVAAAVRPYLDGELVTGLVIGLLDGGRREIYGFGRGPGGRPPTGATLFEVGSVTKAYTALLLADAVTRGEVGLDTPVSELLPPGVTVPAQDGAVITLGQLATHRAGLPRLPPGLLPRQASPDPYAGYGEDALYADLGRTPLESRPGTATSYSNYGVGLLGFALGRRLGGGYPAALAARVLGPLGLRDTFVEVPAAAAGRRAAGTTDDLAPAAPWTFDALAGAGALVSTARDQLALLAAELAPPPALAAAIGRTQAVAVDEPDVREGLGWMLDGEGRRWHNGGTGGFHAFVSFDLAHRRGVVILAATATSVVDRLATSLYDILDGEAPAPLAPPTAAELAPLAGRYDLAGTPVDVALEGRRLYVQAPGEPRVRLMPLAARQFFLEELQGLVVFEEDGGQVARLALSLGGRRITAPRVASPAAGRPGPGGSPPASPPPR